MIELIIYILILITILILLGFMLGSFISKSFIEDKKEDSGKIDATFEFIERIIYKISSIDPLEKMNGKQYFTALILINITIMVFAALLLICQNNIPYISPADDNLDLTLIFHTVTSFITNTNQNHTFPELQLTSLSKYFVLPLLMFISSSTGLSVGIMFIRSLTKGELGNFYTDFIKSFTRILLPICLILSIIFVTQGVPNTFNFSIPYVTLENVKETLLLGPIAAIQAIKIFGQNGGDIFKANSSYPFCNPTYISNFVQTAFMLIIPVALMFTLGFCLKNPKQSIVILLALFSILVFEICLSTVFELQGNEGLNAIVNQSDVNWVGKETRFGIIGSSAFSIATTNTSGATNSSLESYHPLSIAFMLFNMANQSIFGGQGVGPIFAINYFLYTVIFIGFMLGKTPELFGRKVEKTEIILSSLLLLIGPFSVLLGFLFILNLQPDNLLSFYDHIHHYTRIFYELMSASANNGSGLEGLIDNNPYLNLILSLVIVLGWYGSIALMIALASSLGNKAVRTTSGTTFKTDTILFSFLYLFMSITLTLLIYLPFIILGPVIEVFMNN